MKICCRCKQSLPHSDFNQDRGSKDGHDAMCRTCRKDQKAAYYQKHRERVIAKVAEYQKAHPEGVNERNRRSYEKHRDEKLSWGRAYYAENREKRQAQITASKDKDRNKVRQQNAKWFREHPGKAAEYEGVRRARKLSAPTVEQIDRQAIVERDKAICHICLTAVDLTLPYRHPMSLTLDHVIPLAKGGAHTAENLKVAHWRCNSRKSTRQQPR